MKINNLIKLYQSAKLPWLGRYEGEEFGRWFKLCFFQRGDKRDVSVTGTSSSSQRSVACFLQDRNSVCSSTSREKTLSTQGNLWLETLTLKRKLLTPTLRSNNQPSMNATVWSSSSFSPEERRKQTETSYTFKPKNPPFKLTSLNSFTNRTSAARVPLVVQDTFGPAAPHVSGSKAKDSLLYFDQIDLFSHWFSICSSR